MNKLIVGIPCYNEEENIETLVEKWLLEKENIKKYNYELIISPLDDKSTDSTKEILEKMQSKYNEVKPLFHRENKNLGGGVNTIFDYFLEIGESGDLLSIMDGDNTQDPKYISSMLDKIKLGNDIVIASRYREGSKVIGVPKHRILMSYLARFYYTIVLHIKNARDYTCGYRLYSYDSVKNAKKKFKNNLVTQRSFACMMEVLYKIYISGGKISEVPFILRYDNKLGESKIDIVGTSKDSIFTALKIKSDSKNYI